MHDFYLLERNATTLSHLTVPVDVIYLDPPFNLNRRFHMEHTLGFDDYWESEEAYITWYANIITACYHVLQKNGTIYCHNNFVNNALVLAALPEKIRKTFDTNISWKRSHPHNNIKLGWGNITDSIMVLKKGTPYFQSEYGTLDDTYKNNSFNNMDERGAYALGPITGEKSRPGHMFTFQGFTPTYGWRKSYDGIVALHAENKLHYGKNKPYKKIYLSESKGPPIQNFWDDIHPITRSEHNKRQYPTQKPVKLLERIVRASCPPNGLVLDPFCGSGTTMIAVHTVGGNRRCICADSSHDALGIAREMARDHMIFPDEDGTDIWSL